jgi:hypothetical protein
MGCREGRGIKTESGTGAISMTSQNAGCAKAACLGLLVLIMAMSAGCTYHTRASQGAMNNQIVTCSHFSKITDDYLTPEGRYLEIGGYGRGNLASEASLDYPENLKGKYASCNLLYGCEVWNLTPLSENETGMRDACRVEP